MTGVGVDMTDLEASKEECHVNVREAVIDPRGLLGDVAEAEGERRIELNRYLATSVLSVNIENAGNFFGVSEDQ